MSRARTISVPSSFATHTSVTSMHASYRSAAREPSSPEGCLVQPEQARPEVAERMAEQAGDLYLGDAELLADLVLGHATVEAHEQDLLFMRRQFAPVRGDGLHVEHVIHLRVLLAEEVSQQSCTGLTGQRSVQRGRFKGHLSQLGIPQLMAADSERSGQVGLGRYAPELLGQLPGRRTGLHHQFLDGPHDVNMPALVPEVPFDLAVNVRA